MQNDQKQYVDLYVPRKCFATNKLLDAKDNASVQITLSDVRHI
jgi:small subunit ribosomal protein S21e